jgi:N-acetylglucosamine kinase-like BadF-type ATPase
MVRENRRELLERFPDKAPLLAVDGGASKIDAALIGADGSVLAATRHRAYANFNFGHEPPLDALGEAIRRVASQAGVSRDSQAIARVGLFCLAGADLPLDDRRIARQVRSRHWVDDVLLRNDTFAILRAGTDRGWGVAVVCGSGLNCAGVGPDGRIVRFPALGELSGDLAHGGGWLGRAALGAALRGRDRRGPHTELETLVPEHFHVKRPEAVMEALYTLTLDPMRMLELAPIVFRAAADGDGESRGLLDQLADEIVATANAAVRRLRLSHLGFDVILGGGVFRARDAAFLGRIREGINAVAPAATMKRLEAPPVVGAALLALDAIKAKPAAKERVRDELGKTALARR